MDSLDISMAEVMDAVETGFAALGNGLGQMPAKIGVHPREDSFVHAMPCHLGGDIDRAGVKCIAGYPTNPARGLPYISGVMIVNDPATGLPVAIMDAARLTAWRTGAASGVYARHFGNPGTTRLTIVGTGVQGRTNLLAMKEVFPSLNEVRCCGLRERSIQRFIDEMSPELPDAVLSLHTDLEAAVRDTDVLITCTPMVEEPERPVRRKWLKDDCLVIAVDYDACVNEDVFADAHFTCDHREQYIRTQEAGTYFQKGYPRPEEIDADLCEICAGDGLGLREGRRGAVLMGIAAHDIMASALINELAARADVGTLVEL
ncbi:ornithine cyclodeaminase family protein [uncultured Pseudodesulfovibrio sp.]|uniref:ornithine cyclodeaminase family protein n=1 Tax=uncultured Pseudodesulfovibrio sp. TaxID=2035858 RepID=UPI0029C880E8|nr:ornithine cyclodeaminase family protein [uncultured Pseudodesulfovibrio sp.]